jgi:hypothetical protein
MRQLGFEADNAVGSSSFGLDRKIQAWLNKGGWLLELHGQC